MEFSCLELEMIPEFLIMTMNIEIEEPYSAIV